MISFVNSRLGGWGEDFAEGIWGARSILGAGQYGMVICGGGTGQEAEMFTRWACRRGRLLRCILRFRVSGSDLHPMIHCNL